MTKYLDSTGLSIFWSKLKGYFLPLSGGTVTGTLTLNSPLSIESGGTNATTMEGARRNLGAANDVHTHDGVDIVSGTVPVAHGGTGADGSTAAGALTVRGNLGVGVKLWGDGAWTGNTITLTNLTNYKQFIITLNNTNVAIPCVLNADKFVGSVIGSMVSGTAAQYIFIASVSGNTLTFGYLGYLSHISSSTHSAASNFTSGVKAIYGIA